MMTPGPKPSMSTPSEGPTSQPSSGDQMELRGIDHVEFWVGNATQAALFYCAVMGFTRVAYAGPETGVRTHVSHVLVQGDITFVVTGGLDPDGDIADHVRRHGDGLRRVAFSVEDAAVARDRAVARGATARGPIRERADGDGMVRYARIAAWPDADYVFVSRHDHRGAWMPGWEPVAPVAQIDRPGVGLTAIDHVVANVPEGALSRWVEWHGRILGLHPVAEFSSDVSTERTALSSTVLANATGSVMIPVNEPAPGRSRSQISEFLDAWGGAGIQHLALGTDDILTAVATMRSRGLAFLAAGEGYHQRAHERIGEMGVDWDEIERQGVLVDQDDRGHLLQLFTEPVQDRPTLFFEIIQRMGAIGFGAGNFGALFASMELAQERRGNL